MTITEINPDTVYLDDDDNFVIHAQVKEVSDSVKNILDNVSFQVFLDGKPHGIVTYEERAEEIEQSKANEITAAESRYAALSRDAAKTAHTTISNPEVVDPSRTG